MKLQPTKWIEAQINRILTGDPQSIDALKEYKGKILAIELINTSAHYYVTIVDDGIRIDDSETAAADVTVRATPLALISYLTAIKRTEPLASGVMEITGDIRLAQSIQTIFRNIDIDWEERLSYWLGDILAHKTGRFLEHSADILRQANKSLQQDMSEYLKYESNYLITDAELEKFNADVDRLRDDADRLKARIDRIQRKSAGNQEC